MARSPWCRVASGAELLNVNVPDWAERVNIAKIDIQSKLSCVLGQVFESFHEGMYIFGFEKFEHVFDHGFACEVAEQKTLEMIWIRAIVGRLEARAPTNRKQEQELVCAG